MFPFTEAVENLIKQGITRQLDTRYRSCHGFYILNFPDISWLLVTLGVSTLQFIFVPKTIDRQTRSSLNE